MTAASQSWVTARKVAGVDAHSLPKRTLSEPVSSSKQSSLGDTAVAAEAQHSRFNLGRLHDERWRSGCMRWWCPNATQIANQATQPRAR